MKCDQKRRMIEMDTDLDFGPSPKRQRGLCQSNNPLIELLAQEINSDSSSECLSIFKVIADSPYISDNPNSPERPNLPYGPDSPDTPNRGPIIDSPQSPDTPNRGPIIDSPQSPDTPNRGPIIYSPQSPDTPNRGPIIDSPDSPDTPNRGPIIDIPCSPDCPHYDSPGRSEILDSRSNSRRFQVKHFEEFSHSHYDDCMTPTVEPEILRPCPLPALSWANAHDVWQLMCKKDEQASCLRDVDMLDRHPSLQPRMRAILLVWMTEVCEVYKLHRETYYLAVDYLDRYLNVQRNIQKTHLQLIGITCLYCAAKVENIYSPRVGEFAYITDGACQESDILQQEILLLQTLDWNVCPVTPVGWLGIYMQLNVTNRTPALFQTAQNITKNPSILQQQPAFNNSGKTSTITVNVDSISSTYQQFTKLEFVRTAQLLDLSSLDIGFANYPYSVLAAAAISHTFSRETAVRCSGLDWQTIRPCARWMAPLFEVVLQESHNLHLLEQNEEFATKNILGHTCQNIVTDDSHIMQTHNISMAMFDRACLIRQQILAMAIKIREEASQRTGFLCPDSKLTPSPSSQGHENEN